MSVTAPNRTPRAHATSTTTPPAASSTSGGAQAPSGDTVERGEKLLHQLGFDTGRVDRTFTGRTEEAVKSFQAAVGLDPTGALDVRTLNAMRHAKAQKDHHVEGAGQKSKTIEGVEKQLRRLGYDVGPADGVYDGKTAAAVRAFKHDEGIRGNAASRGLLGAGGRRTLRAETRALNHAPYHARVDKTAARARDDARVAQAASTVHADGSVGLGKGSTGKSVSVVQAHLRAAGFDPKHSDGKFDERTEGMLKIFQRKNGLDVSGRVDAPTWSKLQKATLEAKSGTSPAQTVGERSKAVKSTEKMLHDLGLHTGKVDGTYTGATQKAVDAFRKKHHLGNIGAGVGPGTLRSIRKAWKAKNSANLNTVRGCAQFLLRSKNVSFWSGLSTGSDRKNLERLARGQKALVPATGGSVTPKLSLMQALVDMAKHGPIQINALTGGHHSTGSNHYRGAAVDLELSVGNTSEIVSIANRHGGARNFETDHIHLDF